jgi:A/G-specific adenine glycosylase
MYKYLEAMIRDRDPGMFNQAMMDFGALQCKARTPDCQGCPLSAHCVAWRDGVVHELPVRGNRPRRRERYFHYFIFTGKKGVVIRKRDNRDIWRHMYEFPCIETTGRRIPPKPVREKLYRAYGYTGTEGHVLKGRRSQTLTHQVIHCNVYLVQGRKHGRKVLPEGARFELLENLENFALPNVLRTFLKDNSLYI